jgi:SNW domain-containing protein 1
MSTNDRVALFQHNSGNPHAHNFRNNYLDDSELAKPSKSIATAIAAHTQEQINKVLGVRTQVAQQSLGNQVKAGTESQLIRYTPNQQGAGHNSGAMQRIVKMKEVQVDPLAPPQFKHKRVARGPPSPPVTIMRSPPKKLTVKDQQEWKVPPCISNWKNARGYTIPLEMRLSADGRTLKQHTINEKFSKFSDTIYITEKQARREIDERNQITQSINYKEHLKKEDELRMKAKEAKEEKEKVQKEHMDAQRGVGEEVLTEEEKRALKQREILRYINQREQEREQRMARAGINKSKFLRDSERDISEKIALGQAQPTLADSMIDQRLFNQDSGLDHGFKDDEENMAYDKPLFKDRELLNIYGGLKDVQEDLMKDNEETEVEKVLRKRPHAGFEGADDKAGTRTKPVEFEKGEANDDYFGMQGFISQKKKKQE